MSRFFCNGRSYSPPLTSKKSVLATALPSVYMGTCHSLSRERKPSYIQKWFMVSKRKGSLIGFVACWKGSCIRHWICLQRSRVFSLTKPFLDFGDLTYLAGTKMPTSSESCKLVNWKCSVNASLITDIFRLNNKILWLHKYNIWGSPFLRILILFHEELSNFILWYAPHTIAKHN